MVPSQSKPGSVRLKHLLMLAGGIVLTCCSLIAASFLVQAWNIQQQAQFEADEMARYELVLRVVNAISAERGPSNNAMTGEGEAVITALRAKRAKTDGRIDVMQAAFSHELQKTRPEFGPFALLRAHLRSSRVAVDQVAALPKEERKIERIAAAISAMFQCADVAFVLRDRLGGRIVEDAPTLAAGIGFVNDATTLREMTGRLGSHVVMMLSDRAAGDGHQMNVKILRSKIDFVWGDLRTYSLSYFDSENIDRAARFVEKKYFATSLPFLLDVVKRLQDGKAIAPNVFTDRYVSGLKAAENMREEIIRTTILRAGERATNAFRTVIIGVASLAVICLLLVSFALLARRMLFAPLFRARKQIMLLTNEGFDRVKPERTPSLEMQEMFDAITILHGHLREKKRLEKEQTRLTEKLRLLSERDPLTGLLNRRAIEQMAANRLLEADANDRPLAVMILDLDHFKRINDSFGHAVGDLVLKSTAERMSTLLRSGDAIARFGGEEFLIILDPGDGEQATDVAERVRIGIAAMAIDHAPAILVTASLGVAVRQPQSVQTWTDLVALADDRLYRAKARGRNNVCGDDEGRLASALVDRWAG